MTLSRRTFIQASTGALVVAASGCSRTPVGIDAPTPISRLPVHVPFDRAPIPDVPGSADGIVPPAYFSYPRDLVDSTRVAPGHGGQIRALCLSFAAPAPGMKTNRAWQEVNRRLNAQLMLTTTTYTDYSAKLGTILASGDLPDLVYLHDTKSIPRQTEVLNRLFTDLGPYLEGDAVSAYPNLANFSSFHWRNGTFNGVLQGVPNARGGYWWLWELVNARHLREIGSPPLRNSDDFTRMLQETRRAGRYGIVADNAFPPGLVFAAMLWRAPKNWRELNGRFIKDIETEEFKAAVGYCRELWRAGLFYPTMPAQAQALDLFYNGQASLYQLSTAATKGAWDFLANNRPEFELDVLTPFGHDGGPGVYHFATGSYGKVVIRKAPRARIEELLGVLNFLAAPFGTTEHHLINFGVEGVDHRWDENGVPSITPRGQAELNVPFAFLMSGPDVIYSRIRSEAFARNTHRWMSDHAAIAITDPTIGLAAPTASARGAVLEQNLRDELRDIIVGRTPLSAYESMITAWRRHGGDAMRGEYEKAYASNRV